MKVISEKPARYTRLTIEMENKEQREYLRTDIGEWYYRLTSDWHLSICAEKLELEYQLFLENKRKIKPLSSIQLIEINRKHKPILMYRRVDADNWFHPNGVKVGESETKEIEQNYQDSFKLLKKCIPHHPV